MSEIMFEIVALGFRTLKVSFSIFQRAAGVGEIGDIVGVDGQIVTKLLR